MMQGIGMVDRNSTGMRRLKQWLIDQIDSDQYPGLVWDDEQKVTFRIPWKHAGKQDYNQEVDASIFKAWAIFKGKYKEGEKAEPATWKTRLRCALNKSPDFEEVTDRSQLDISEPYKVYRIVPEGQQKCKFGNHSNEQGDVTDMDCSPPGSDELIKDVIVDYNGIIKRSHSPPQEDCTSQPQQDWWGRQTIEDSSVLYYANNFGPLQPNSALQLSTENPQCVLPDNKVIICFGEEFPDMKPINKKLIIVEIEQMKTKHILQAVLQSRNYDNNIHLQISNETAEDKLSGILHELCMNSFGYPRPAYSENQQIS
ncbi:interferon regulatory factor 8 isoform X4 [Rhincodon typus]|uniref:interferon regulatory factor 8 isoform X4 n=1 Tax=Rhincodon typus TaxID=259920 RepID=UPI00202F49CC|nr:interferon regulatory factor 8 isoform X4 [Rhincodon typus]